MYLDYDSHAIFVDKLQTKGDHRNTKLIPQRKTVLVIVHIIATMQKHWLLCENLILWVDEIRNLSTCLVYDMEYQINVKSKSCGEIYRVV